MSVLGGDNTESMEDGLPSSITDLDPTNETLYFTSLRPFDIVISYCYKGDNLALKAACSHYFDEYRNIKSEQKGAKTYIIELIFDFLVRNGANFYAQKEISEDSCDAPKRTFARKSVEEGHQYVRRFIHNFMATKVKPISTLVSSFVESHMNGVVPPILFPVATYSNNEVSARELRGIKRKKETVIHHHRKRAKLIQNHELLTHATLPSDRSPLVAPEWNNHSPNLQRNIPTDQEANTMTTLLSKILSQLEYSHHEQNNHNVSKQGFLLDIKRELGELNVRMRAVEQLLSLQQRQTTVITDSSMDDPSKEKTMIKSFDVAMNVSDCRKNVSFVTDLTEYNDYDVINDLFSSRADDHAFSIGSKQPDNGIMHEMNESVSSRRNDPVLSKDSKKPVEVSKPTDPTIDSFTGNKQAAKEIPSAASKVQVKSLRLTVRKSPSTSKVEASEATNRTSASSKRTKQDRKETPSPASKVQVKSIRSSAPKPPSTPVVEPSEPTDLTCASATGNKQAAKEIPSVASKVQVKSLRLTVHKSPSTSKVEASEATNRTSASSKRTKQDRKETPSPASKVQVKSLRSSPPKSPSTPVVVASKPTDSILHHLQSPRGKKGTKLNPIVTSDLVRLIARDRLLTLSCGPLQAGECGYFTFPLFDRQSSDLEVAAKEFPLLKSAVTVAPVYQRQSLLQFTSSDAISLHNQHGWLSDNCIELFRLWITRLNDHIVTTQNVRVNVLPTTDVRLFVSRTNEEEDDVQKLIALHPSVSFSNTDYMLVPFGVSTHWSLLILSHIGQISTKYKSNVCIYVLDSKSEGKKNRNVSRSTSACAIQKSLYRFLSVRLRSERNDPDSIDVTIQNCPMVDVSVTQQKDNSSCGLFVINYIRQFYNLLVSGKVNGLFEANSPILTFPTHEITDLRTQLSQFCKKIKEKYDLNISILRYVGLRNNSALCYANATLQFLFACPMLFLCIDMQKRTSLPVKWTQQVQEIVTKVYCDLLELFEQSAVELIEQEVNLNDLYAPESKTRGKQKGKPVLANHTTPSIKDLVAHLRLLASIPDCPPDIRNKTIRLFQKHNEHQTSGDFLQLLAELEIFQDGVYRTEQRVICGNNECRHKSISETVARLPLYELNFDKNTDSEIKTTQELLNEQWLPEPVPGFCEMCNGESRTKQVIPKCCESNILIIELERHMSEAVVSEIFDEETQAMKKEYDIVVRNSPLLIDFYRNDGLISFANKSFQIKGIIYHEHRLGKDGSIDFDKGHYYCESFRPYHLLPKAVDAHMEWYRFDDSNVTRIGPDLGRDSTMSMNERFLHCNLLLYMLAPEETTLSQVSSVSAE